MAKADQHEQQHDRVSKPPAVDPSILADMEEPATAQVRALLQQGVANAGMFGKIVHENPSAKGEIVALLNNKLGNHFTSQVIMISEVEDSRHAPKRFTNEELHAMVDDPSDKKPESAIDTRKPIDPYADNPKQGPSGGVSASNTVIGASNETAPQNVDKKELLGPSTPKPPKRFTNEELHELLDDPSDKKPDPAVDTRKPIDPYADNPKQGASGGVSASNTVIGASNETAPQNVDKKELLGPSTPKPPKRFTNEELHELLDDPSDKKPGESESKPAEDEKGSSKGNHTGPVRVTGSALHVRSSPSTKGNKNILGTLPHGKVVTAIGNEGDWVKIEYKGQEAFIFGAFVEAVADAPGSTAAVNPKAGSPGA